MSKWKSFYVIRIQFLGYRYHGWQKQTDLKTIHGMIDKTLWHVLGHDEYKTLGCGRTDAKVSAEDYAFELFLLKPLSDLTFFLSELNRNFPSDIRALGIEQVSSKFNIIQNAKTKEYHYYFSYGDKFHPFNGPLICYCGPELAIENMKLAAKEFLGFHNFRRFTSKPTENTILEREIALATIEKADNRNGNFFPEDIYIFKVKSKGFLRYQVRLMMGALIDVGLGEWSVDDLKESITNPDGHQIKRIAPSSGLVLHKLNFE